MIVRGVTALGSGGGRAARAGRGGFTLMELALAMTILLIALLSVSASTLRSHTLRRHNREHTVAHNALRAYAEQIHSASVEASTTPGTWGQALYALYGPGGSVGTQFDVPELDRASPGVPVGSIRLVTDETLSDADLGVNIGMPRDLDGDGAVSETDVTASAKLLPMILSVEWTGVSGVQRIDVPFYVMGY